MTAPLRRVALAAVLVAPVALAAAPAAAAVGPSWHIVATGSGSHFRGLSAVSARVAWLGGYDGVVLRTTDGGASWRDVSPPGAGALQFRDIEAFDSDRAVAMAAGVGTDSRLYSTRDGGAHWSLTYTNHDPAAFYDCMAFINQYNGFVLSDPVDGKFRILETWDGGSRWYVTSPAGMPAALPGEFAFAASGGCLSPRGSRDIYFGTGGAATARVFHSRDNGRSWRVGATPVASGPSAGIFALAFRDKHHGLVIGGDFAKPHAADRALALSVTQGRSWKLPAEAPGGYRSGVAYLPGSRAVVAVGLTGSDLSYDGGRSWTRFDSGSFDSVACAPDGACWASGDLGRVGVLRR